VQPARKRTQYAVVRSLLCAIIALWLSLAGGTVFADDSSDAQGTPPAEDQAPSGPILQPADYTPVICDPSAGGFHYLEVRGSGFDAWATQRLVGNVVDANGVPQIRWSSIWVSPQGRLTIEVNLCADPFQNRPALGAGDYTVSVGPGGGAPIAATGITLAPPPQPSDQSDQTSPDTVAAPAPAVINAAPPPTPGARVGPGSQQQPYALGAPGKLVDGWQLVITGASPDAFNEVLADIPSAVAPPSDQRDFLIRAQATYQGQGTGVFSGLRLALVSGIGTTYDQIHNSCGVIAGSIPPNVVTSGTTVRGNVCFTVRASDTGSLVAYDNQTLPSDRLYFSLQ
jgi:hypothetical protein